MGAVVAGVCDYDEKRYQSRKARRRGTRAGSVAIYCAHEAIRASPDRRGKSIDKARVGVFVGTTEHGNVETENEIASLREYGDDTKFWSHHHNPRTVANNPAGEVTINLGITGPHYCLGRGVRGRQRRPGFKACRCSSWVRSTSPWAAGSPSRFTPSVSLRASRPRARWRATKIRPRPRAPFDVGPQRHRGERRAAACSPSSGSMMRSPATRPSRRGRRLRGELRRRRLRACPLAERQAQCMSSRALTSASIRSPTTSISSAPTQRARPRATYRKCRAISRGVRRLGATCGSTTPRASSATRWVPPERSSSLATCLRSGTATCIRPSTWTNHDPECAVPNLVVGDAG